MFADIRLIQIGASYWFSNWGQNSHPTSPDDVYYSCYHIHTNTHEHCQHTLTSVSALNYHRRCPKREAGNMASSPCYILRSLCYIPWYPPYLSYISQYPPYSCYIPVTHSHCDIFHGSSPYPCYIPLYATIYVLCPTVSTVSMLYPTTSTISVLYPSASVRLHAISHSIPPSPYYVPREPTESVL